MRWGEVWKCEIMTLSMDNSCERGNATEVRYVVSRGANKPELQKVQNTNMHRKACEKGNMSGCTATPQDAVRGLTHSKLIL